MSILLALREGNPAVIGLTKATDAELWSFLWCELNKRYGWTNGAEQTDTRMPLICRSPYTHLTSQLLNIMMTSSMETFCAICAGNSPVTGEFLAQRPVTRSFDVFFDLRLNKRLSIPSWGNLRQQSSALWRHWNDILDVTWYINNRTHPFKLHNCF